MSRRESRSISLNFDSGFRVQGQPLAKIKESMVLKELNKTIGPLGILVSAGEGAGFESG